MELSNCCLAPILVVGAVTKYNHCMKCSEPCNRIQAGLIKRLVVTIVDSEAEYAALKVKYEKLLDFVQDISHTPSENHYYHAQELLKEIGEE